MARHYDICEQGDVLLALSDKELGALLRAVIQYRRGLPVGELPYNVKCFFAGEKVRIDSDAAHRRQVSESRRNAIRQRWDRSNEYNSIQMNTNVNKCKKLPPLSTPITVPPDFPPTGENTPPKGLSLGTSPRKAAKKFVKPSVTEVKAYCLERGNSVNAEDFCNFYEAKGWVVGKAPMKDWKAAVRTWESKSRQENKGQDFREIERMPL